MLHQPIQSLQWKDDYLRMLDQTKLPEEIVFLELTESPRVWEAIRNLQVRGAPAIGIAAAYGVYLGMRNWCAVPEHASATHEQFGEELLHHINYLSQSRPTAVHLFWALDRMKRVGMNGIQRALPVSEITEHLLQEAKLIHQEDEHINRQIGEYALQLFKPGDGVLTHCNAGGLATAKYGTALAPFYLAHERGIELKIFADETRPVLQGSRLTAFELQQAGIDVTLICDNMAGLVMSKGWIQAVIVGTDRVAANGDVANKIGTYSVAVLAKAHGIPFYVACPLSTIDLHTPTGADIPIEERHEDEITQGFGKRTAPAGVKVYNPAFDVTPQQYVTAIITEKGILRAPYDQSLKNIIASL